MPNQLIHETSPYLLQHAHNPVNWYPWGEQALEKARQEDKPIFLSIGYAACHWCHVMAHESFEDPVTAAFLNEHFVSIKVDREERPDLDSLYMNATVALTGSGGWPMSVFLTPDLQPFYAGTYFPPTRRYNLPSFREVLQALASVWQNEREKALRSAEQVVAHIQQQTASSRYQLALSPQHLDQAVESLRQAYDWGYGGWGGAPKFPQPMTIEFLLRRHCAGNPQALQPAVHALHSMARGGMYDVVGGGFARYSTDNFWRVPHFEKMLYDNAQLARAYLHAWQITGQPAFYRVLTETLTFVAREMTHPDGGFYSSIDADSEGVEGKFYVWTKEEIRSHLLEKSEFFEAAYGVTEQGNWEGKTVLQRALDDSTLAARFGLDPRTVPVELAECHARLLAARDRRPRPATDDKILTAWNGLMLATLAEAARVIGLAESNRESEHTSSNMAARLAISNTATRTAETTLHSSEETVAARLESSSMATRNSESAVPSDQGATKRRESPGMTTHSAETTLHASDEDAATRLESSSVATRLESSSVATRNSESAVPSDQGATKHRESPGMTTPSVETTLHASDEDAATPFESSSVATRNSESAVPSDNGTDGSHPPSNVTTRNPEPSHEFRNDITTRSAEFSLHELYYSMATRNAEFLLTALRPKGQLRRSWRDGKTTQQVFLEDYAALILGLLELYQTDFQERWYTAALELAEEMIARFSDPQGGFFDTPADGERLFQRPKDLQDNATPSGGALSCEALLKLAALSGNGRYRELAEQALRDVAEAALRYPTAFGRWLSAADFALGNGKQAAVLGETGAPDFQALMRFLRAEYRPNLVVAASAFPPSQTAPALLAERPLVDGKATAYVCEDFICKRPVTSVEQLRDLL